MLAISGCTEPSGVGLDLVDETGLEPTRVEVLPQEILSRRYDKVTGAVRGTAAFSGAVSSFLTGYVDDPVLGARSVAGYVDFRNDNAPDDFAEDSVLFAELVFERQYLYGDTTGTQLLAVEEMGAAWDPADKPSDEDFGAGEQVATASFVHSDTLISVRLPDTWVAARQSVLRNEDFNDLFHGFRVAPENTSLVLGIAATASFLRLGTASDTVDFVVERIFSSVREVSTVPPPADRVTIADGIGDGMSVVFSFDQDVPESGVVNRAVLRLPIDTLALRTPEGSSFVRPELVQLNMYGERDGERDLLGTTIRTASGEFSFVGLSVATEETFLRSVQAALLGEPTYSSYVLLPSPASNTLNTAFLRVDGESGPRATLTLLPN